MAGKILLININQCESPYSVFPLGLSHLDAAVRRAGHETAWFDCAVDREALPGLIARVKPDFIGISLRNIDDVVIKKRETYFGQLITLVRELRQLTDSPIILGGSGFSIFPERLLELSGADWGIQGEGEIGLPALLRVLEDGGEYANFPGLVFRHDGKIIANPQQSDLAALEILPPDRPAHLASFYLQNSSMLNVQTQRGCAMRCCYCTYPVIEGRRHRYRAPELVVEELRRIEAAGAGYVFIVDSVFNSSSEHVLELCEAIIRAELKLNWGCFLRPKNLTSNLIKTMAQAGLAHIEFGSDSFCDSVLEAYGKGFVFEDILHSSELARAEKIDFCHFLISGGPGETRETMQLGFENSLRLKDAVILAFVGMRIYPRTPLFDRALREGRIAPNADLLEPKYYLCDELTEEEIFKQLREFSRRSPGWIVGDPNPNYIAMAKRLRARGAIGPLWSYFATMQRLALS